MKYGASELLPVLDQMRKAKEGKVKVTDIIMPNGKRLADCTGQEVREVGEAFTALGKLLSGEGEIQR